MVYESELCHFGIKGQKWGVRRFQRKDGTRTPAGKKRYSNTDEVTYRPKSIKAAIAKRSNDKVDAGFKNWNENVKKRDDAIELGKKSNAAKLAYEKDPSNKALRDEAKAAEKAYKTALKSNTTYRKGVVRQDVGRDAARKYLSEAKKIKKQLGTDPSNKQLQKKYADMMSKHDIERAKARRAVEVSAKRSTRVASIKRTMTKTVKAVATTAVISAGLYAANRYLNNHQVTINGKRVNLSTADASGVIDMANKVKNVLGYFY